jgi:hypothetical protein
MRDGAFSIVSNATVRRNGWCPECKGSLIPRLDEYDYPEAMCECDDSGRKRPAKPRRQKEYTFTYPVASRVKSNVDRQNERARDIGSRGQLDHNEWKRWLDAFNKECAYCGMITHSECIEHVYPLWRGGENTIYNTVPACRACNMSKFRSRVERWLQPRELERFIDRVMAATARLEREEPGGS